MAFVRTFVIIAVLLLGWAAARSVSSAHVMPAPAAGLNAAALGGGVRQ